MTNASQWSTTAGSNNSASPNGFPEGMAPSGVNDAAREVMAAVARWYQDLNASITSGGSSNAYTLTTNNAHAAIGDVGITAFKANHANDGPATLNVDGTGAQSIKKHNDQDLVEGDIEVGQVLVVLNDGTNYQIISLLGRAPIFQGVINLDLSNGTDADHDIDIATGRVWNEDYTDLLILSSALTKQIDAAWAVGTAAGGLDTGAVAASTLYAVWLIKRTDTGVVDALFSLSFTSPTMPTNYDKKRLIWFVVTDASSNIIAFIQSGDYCRLTGALVLDVSDSTITSQTFETGTLSVPPSCLAHIYGLVSNTGETSTEMRLTVRTAGAPENAAAASEAFIAIDANGAPDALGGIGSVLVNSSSQINYTTQEVAGTATVTIKTLGCLMLTRSNP